MTTAAELAADVRAAVADGPSVVVDDTAWAVGDDGRLGKVVDVSSDSREGRELIDAATRRRGLRKKLHTPARVALATALLSVGGTVVGGVVVLALAVTGNLGRATRS